MPPLHQTIRQRTAAAHAALERTPLMCAFAGDSLSVAVYRRYLALQWQLHAPLEAELARWLPPEWVAQRLRKTEWLLQDLALIGAPPAEPMDAPLALASWAQAMGVMYVLEGSTLGLQVVRKQLQDQHPALREAGRFMLGYGPDTGRQWRGFLAALEAVPVPEWPAVEAAACATFEHFLAAFSRTEALAEPG